MKFSRRRSDAFFGFRRFSMLSQFSGIDPAGFSTHFNGNIPVTNLFAVSQRGLRKGNTNPIIGKTKAPPPSGHEIRREPFRQTGVVPVGIEHEWRTHDHSTASIEPLLLF